MIEDARTLVNMVEGVFTAARQRKLAIERVWYEVILAYLGHQWRTWDPNSKEFRDLIEENWAPRPVTNFLVPTVETKKSKFVKNQPTASVEPNSQDYNDKVAAEVGGKVLGWLDDKLEMDTLNDTALDWALLTGHVFSIDSWNSKLGRYLTMPEMQTADVPVMAPSMDCQQCGYTEPAAPPVGDPMGGEVDVGVTGPPQAANCPQCGGPMVPGEMQESDPMTGEPAFNQEEQPVIGPDGMPVVKSGYEGDVMREIVSPFEMYVDERGRDIYDPATRWVLRARSMSLDWFEENFPGSGVKEEAVDEPTFFQNRLSNLVNTGMFSRESAWYGMTEMVKPHGMPGHALYKEYYERPSPRFPMGHKVCMANGVLLDEGPLGELNENGDPPRFPLEEYKYLRVPVRYWGVGLIELILNQQRRINSIDSTIILNRKTMVNPQWSIPFGTRIKKGSVSGRPGLFVEWKVVHSTGGAVKPERLPGIPLPPSVMEERLAAIADLEEVAGTKSVQKGDAPSGVRSGVALNLLEEQAGDRIEPQLKRWYRFLERGGATRLRLIGDKYEYTRLVKVTGEDDTGPEVIHFVGSDLNGNYDVRVKAGSANSTSRAAKQQSMLDAIGTGVLNVMDPRVTAKIKEELGLGDFEGGDSVDRKAAFRLLDQLKQGLSPVATDQMGQPLVDPMTGMPQMSVVGPFDDPMVFFEVLSTFTKKASFAQLPPEVQQNVILVAYHYQQQLMMMQAEAAAQAAQQEGGESDAAGPPQQSSAA